MKQTKKIVSLLLSAIVMFSLLSVCAFAEPIGTTSISLADGKKNTDGQLGDKTDDYIDYKYDAEKDGILELKADITAGAFYIYVVGEDGETLKASTSDVKSGSLQELNGDGGQWLHWNTKIEKFSATLNYKVEKGTYYIRVARGVCIDGTDGGSGKITLTPTLRDDPAPKLECFSLTLKKGDKLTLGTTVTPKGTKLVWSSSKKTVATVSAKGVITAKKAGTTVITCTTEDGSSELRIKITVPKK